MSCTKVMNISIWTTLLTPLPRLWHFFLLLHLLLSSIFTVILRCVCIWGFFSEDISRIINSTITVKTWKFIFLFFSEVSPLRRYYLNLDINLTSYVISKSDLWQRMKQAILIAVLITKIRVNIEKSGKRSHLFWSYSIFCTWQSLHSFAMIIIQKSVEVRCVLEWLMTAISARKSRMYYMIAWVFEKENCL